MKQVRALMEHLVPRVGLAVFQSRILIGEPFVKERRDRVFAAKIGAKCLFKAAAKDHRSSGVFFLPSVHVAVAILPRTTKILANLRVAVDHRVLPPHSW